MRRLILIWIAAGFYYSGLVALARWWTRSVGKRLVILNYHRATEGDLRRHLLYLRQHYHLMHIEAALEALYEPRKPGWSRGDRHISLVLTFDDGYRDNYTHASALARELQVPLSLYLVPGYIESGDYFWWGEGERLVRRARVTEVHLEGKVYYLKRQQDRSHLVQWIDARLRYAQSVREREAFLEEVRETLKVPSSVRQEEEPALPLTWEQIQEMEESGWISFGAHTMHHPILAYLSDPQEVQNEVEQCRKALQHRLGHEVRSFAYPVGQMQHISEEVVEAVQQAGYTWALTTQYGFNTPRTNPYLLHRIEVDVDQHWLVVAAETAGLWGFFSRLRWLPLVRKYFTNSR
jgi:peptidoglycan/xylan/chitin deacetylase (PgdA/CDA1 family)